MQARKPLERHANELLLTSLEQMRLRGRTRIGLGLQDRLELCGLVVLSDRGAIQPQCRCGVRSCELFELSRIGVHAHPGLRDREVHSIAAESKPARIA
jgi:hypothetical protein